MLTMNVELWPHGNKDYAKRLVTINVANVGRSEANQGTDRCDYVWTIDEPKPLFGDPISAQGLLEGYDRKASCVAIMAAVLQDYENQVSDFTLDEHGREIAGRMRKHVST
jgi:hypothetical protein